ncbi:MAG: PaaI family thioesterase [Solirubrobacterales bacterium]
MNDEANAPVLFGKDLNAALGIEIDEVEIGRVTGHFEVDDRVKQPFGIVHGGAHAAIAETLASLGTFRAVAEEGKVAMGMSNQTQFLRAASSGIVRAEAIAIHRGRTTWVWDVTMRDEDDRDLAVCRMTIAVREKRV